MTREAKVQSLRELHAGPEVLLFPNAWDAGSAKILTALGFKAIATTSGGYAFSTDRQYVAAELTREGIIENARSMARATQLPVSADLQNGFGDEPEACAETIRLACLAGLAGGSIEDASDDPQKPIYDFPLSVERVAAAAEAARELGFVLTARA